jgi:hypothetical protein
MYPALVMILLNSGSSSESIISRASVIGTMARNHKTTQTHITPIELRSMQTIRSQGSVSDNEGRTLGFANEEPSVMDSRQENNEI